MFGRNQLKSQLQSGLKDVNKWNNSPSWLSTDLSSNFDRDIFDFRKSASSSYFDRTSRNSGLFPQQNNTNSFTSNNPQNSQNNVFQIGNLRNPRTYTDIVEEDNSLDRYVFSLNSWSSINLSLNGLSTDVDITLFDSNGERVAISRKDGTRNEGIDGNLSAGTYYVDVSKYGTGRTTYRLGLSATPIVNNTRIVEGTLDANLFFHQSEFARTVISGNGNVDFGKGSRDTLDLSNIYSNSIELSLAKTASGGFAYNPGNGTRIFDAINFSNGKQILFEGIDTIKFADGSMNLSVTPNDPLFSQQWNLHMMGVHNAWQFTKGSNQVMVGVQDTGLGLRNGGVHPDLTYPYHFSNNLNDDYLRSPNSHGTSVQGIIAAKSNNGVGMSGINWNSDVFNLDVIDGARGDYDLAEATQRMINFANQKGQRLIINMSLSTSIIAPEFEQLIANNQSRALFVISSGNGSNNGGDSQLADPAILAKKYDNVMAIGASWGTHTRHGQAVAPGQRISYPNETNVRNRWGSNYGQGLTLMGPSEVITTEAKLVNSEVQFDYTNKTPDKFNGTSASAPNVSGVASLVWSANPYLSAAQVKQIMSQTAYNLGNPYEYGAGFVNADAAVRRALAIARVGDA